MVLGISDEYIQATELKLFYYLKKWLECVPEGQINSGRVCMLIGLVVYRIQ